MNLIRKCVIEKDIWKEREVGKFQFKLKNLAKLERTKRNCKEFGEAGKIRTNLERTERTLKFLLKLKSFAEAGKSRCSWKVLTTVEKIKLTSEVVIEVRK